jgi:chromosome segregation and condensation protein ScpB
MMPLDPVTVHNEQVLRTLLLAEHPLTRQRIGATRHRMNVLVEQKLIKRAGHAKNPGSDARRAVTYELTAKGRKRADK